jgi:DoxX-like family
VNLALWMVAIGLAVGFAASGLMKLLVPKDKLVKFGQGWAQDVSQSAIRLIGVAEVLGAAGLILPAVTHIAPILVPLAAIGLILVMVGAAVVHGRRGEAVNIVVNLVLLALAAFVAWGRLGPLPFTS